MTPGADDPHDIRNWRRRPDGVTTSGRLLPGDPARLAAIGVRHVVNLALADHPEALPDEEVALAAHGIGYTHIPVPFDAPTREHVAALGAVLADVEGPVHVHCIMNWRVTAFLYLLDRESGIAEEDAFARMASVWNPLASDDPRAAPWKRLLSP